MSKTPTNSNDPTGLNMLSLAMHGFKLAREGEKKSGQARQTLACVMMLAHEQWAVSAPANEVPGWGAIASSPAAKRAFMDHLRTVLNVGDRYTKSKVYDLHAVRAAAVERANDMALGRALELAIILTSCGVKTSAFNQAASLFVVPIEALIPAGWANMNPKLTSVPLDGLGYGITTMGANGQQFTTVSANLSQLERIYNPAKYAERAKIKKGKGADAVRNAATTTIAATEQIPGADATVKVNGAHTVADFNVLILEANRTVMAWQNDAKVPLPALSDFPANVREALTSLHMFYLEAADMEAKRKQEAEKMAREAAFADTKAA